MAVPTKREVVRRVRRLLPTKKKLPNLRLLTVKELETLEACLLKLKGQEGGGRHAAAAKEQGAY